jgi:hypothetical protein
MSPLSRSGQIDMAGHQIAMLDARAQTQRRQPPEHVEPVFALELVVAQHQIEGLERAGRDRFGTACNAHDDCPQRLEQLDHFAAKGVVVLDDKDVGHGHAITLIDYG